MQYSSGHRIVKQVSIAILVVLACFSSGFSRSSYAQSIDHGKAANQILSITAEEASGQSTIHIQTQDPVGYRYTVYDSNDPMRIVIDFPGMDVSNLTSPIKFETAPVQEVRVSSFDLSSGRLGRVELLLTGQATYNVFLSGNDFRVTFGANAQTPAKAAATEISRATPEIMAASQPLATTDNFLPQENQGAKMVESGPVVKDSASNVQSVSVEGRQAVLQTNGHIGRYEQFTLASPPRLVVDIYDVKPAFKERSFKAAQGFKSIRVGGEHPGKTRFVFDAEGRSLPRHVVDKQESAIVVGWGEKNSQPASKSPVLHRGSAVTVESVEFKVEDGKSILAISLSAPADLIGAEKKGNTVQFGVKNALISRALKRTIDASAFPSAVRLITPYTVQTGKTQEVRFAVELKGPTTYSLQKKKDGVHLVLDNGSFAEAAPAPVTKEEVPVPTGLVSAKTEPMENDLPLSPALPVEEGVGEALPSAESPVDVQKYSGQKISLIFDDADLRKILQLIAEVSELNILVADEVKGSISLRLIDVPWDQALDLIMDIKGLGMLREGNVVRILPKEAIRTMRQAELTAIKDERSVEPVETEIIKVSYTGLANVSGASKELLTDRGKITEDSRNKQLIVTDIPSVIAQIRKLISVLDTPERQVLIEARIVEATSTENLDLGINWGVGYDNQGTSTWGSPQFGEVGFGGNFTIPAFAPATGQAAGVGADMLFGRVGIDSVTLSLRLAALETSGHGKIISNPRVTTLNGEKAKISQGTKIPYQTVSLTEIKTELVEAALSLEVLPVINPDNTVILSIKATNSSPGTTVATGAGAAPSIDTKEAETKMILKDGETTVIGGIFIEREDYSESGVPLIMKLPLFGHLFKSTKTNKNRSELLVFITPRIIQ